MLTYDTLREEAGEKEFAAGALLYRRAMVRENSRTGEETRYTAMDGSRLQVSVTPQGAQCSCGVPWCRHCVAAVLAANRSGAAAEMERSLMRASAPALLNAVTGLLPVSDTMLLRPVLLIKNRELYIALKAGEERLYVVRSIPRFLEARESREDLSFGKGFTYKPSWMRFSSDCENLLDILAEYCAQLSDSAAENAGKILHLKPLTGRRVLESLRNTEFELKTETESILCPGIPEMQSDFSFFFSGTPREIRLTCEVPPDLRVLKCGSEFVWADGAIRYVNEKDRPLVEVLSRFSKNGKALFLFSPEDSPRVLSELLPGLLQTKRVIIGGDLEKRMVRLPLRAEVYLDREGNDITCRTAFRYGEMEIDPFNPASDEKRMLIVRDVGKEYAILDELARDGFHVQGGKVYLRLPERIWDFVTAGAARLGGLCDVFMSRDFRRITVRKPALKGFLSFSGGSLRLEMQNGEDRIDELLPLMEALRRRRRYFRFRDGTFIDLEGTENWQEMAEAVTEAAERTGREDDLGACRAAYFAALIREKALPVEEDAAARDLSDMRCEAPEPPLSCLREYQKRGFSWLWTLHTMGLGGILADEMGLGKTVQMISAILRSRIDEEERLPSLVVTPTTLTYNWLSEIRRFAPSLSVMLIGGSQNARREQIKKILLPDGPDVVITSYPLIRRDIDLLDGITFRYAVLDEAQHVKNAQSVGAHAVKRIRARTRVALTGTPMENHAGELWSLFDFVLPGYLPDYSEFMHRWGDGGNEESLRRRIRPFLMRRVKKDVLGELPEKQETVLMAEMSQEQRQIYDAALLQKKDRIRAILSDKGLGRGRGEVLSAITELRQICCHPRLCLPDYRGASGKMEMLMDLLPEAVAMKKRILLFSQFTSMLRFIRARLEEEGYRTLYLDGETPAAERLDLTERFNSGDGEVFLISLKAGGTGLNLTGADMVIHYDPWWNPTAEEQATGRAHRIGQTRKVEVWKLIMHSSIEEQVLSMSERKRRMFDRLITPGEEMPARLTDKDILALFE